MEYIELEELSQLQELISDSFENDKGALIFKHSTRCAISKMAFQRFKRGWSIGLDEVPVYYLDLLRYRNISDQVSVQFGVKHESPQVLLIRNGNCVYNASHNAISPLAIEELV